MSHPREYVGLFGGESDPHRLKGSNEEAESDAVHPKDAALERAAYEIPTIDGLFVRHLPSSIQSERGTGGTAD
jgi:hypothetical protein